MFRLVRLEIGFLKAGLQIYNNTVQPFAKEISDLENEDGIKDTNNKAINIEISDSDWSECGDEFDGFHSDGSVEL